MKRILILATVVIAIAAIGVAFKPSPTLTVGAAAPVFTLTGVDGKTYNLADYKGKIVVLEWTNAGCPFVIGHYRSGNMQSLQKKYTEKGVVWLAVNSTNANNPEFKSPDQAKKIESEWKPAYTAQLYDSDGKIGKLYNAKTTPHIFVIDKNGNLAYQGAIDDDRSTNGGKNAKVNYLSQAADALLAGKQPETTSTNPYGCSVKY
jgi:peroxiredoxin